MGLLKNLFGGKKTKTVEPKKVACAAPQRTMVTVVTLAPTGSETVKDPMPSPERDPHVSKTLATEPIVVPPKESPEELLERIKRRRERHQELDALFEIERFLPDNRRSKRIIELQKAVFDAIESDASLRDYRVAYYQYQSALLAAKTGR